MGFFSLSVTQAVRRTLDFEEFTWEFPVRVRPWQCFLWRITLVMEKA
jgi:hypothetical protein